jgi:chitodextrinase
VYNWSFGDNNTSSMAAPTHQYAQPGNYTVTLDVTDACGENDDFSLPLSIAVPTNVDAKLTAGELMLYPNPADQFVALAYVANGATAQVEIFDLNGCLVLAQDLPKANGATSVVMNLSKLAAGTYNLRLTQGTDQQTLRLVRN